MTWVLSLSFFSPCLIAKIRQPCKVLDYPSELDATVYIPNFAVINKQNNHELWNGNG
jgi:hypothetical protein